MARIICSHPTGNEFSRAAAIAFLNAGMLDTFYTSVATMPGSWWQSMSSFQMFADLKRRAFDKRLAGKIQTHPFRELGRMASSKLKLGKLVEQEAGFFSVDAVYKDIDRYVAKQLCQQHNDVDTVYCYEDGAYFTFQQAKKQSIKCIYDLPIGYWRTMRNLMNEEKEINPAWAPTIGGFKDSAKKLDRKDGEIALADRIIAASKFTYTTLSDYPGTLPEISIIPYGFPPVKEKKYRALTKDQELKLLFVGGLSQRKGLSYLFKAVDGFSGRISLTVIGRAGSYHCKPLMENLAKHTWIETLSHEKILEAMAEHDVLILPSLFEGFGLVITEAMSRGTPVITTERTAGPDIIRHGENGWLAKSGSVDEIKAILEQVISDPGIMEEAGRKALETARQRPWDVYGSELVQAIGMFNENR